MTGRKERRARRSAKGETPVEEVKVQLTPEPQAVDFLKVPRRGDSPRDFRSLHREKSPFEIGEKPDVQVASQKAIIDKALIMDISGGVTNVDEYISLFFTDSCSLDPASCGDISTVKIEIVEEDTSAPDAPKPASEHEKTITEAEAELEAKRIEEEGKLAAIQEAQAEPEPAPEPEPIPEPPPAEPEEPEEESSEEEEEIVPPREPTPPPPPPPKEPTPEPIKKSPSPEYDSDVELIPPKEDFDPSLWKSVDDIEKQLVDSEGGKDKKPKSKEASRRESTHEMTERERDLEWQRQRQLMRPPLVISHLKSRAAPKGSTVKLTCTISGPGITVRWFKDGDPIEKNPRHTFKVSEGLLSLEIKDVEFSDAGEYSCIIKNKNGETSTSTSVQVYENIESKPIPPTFISIKDQVPAPANVSSPSEAAPVITDVPVEKKIGLDAGAFPAKDENPNEAIPGKTPDEKTPEEIHVEEDQGGVRLRKREPEKSPPLPQYGDDMVKYHHKRILHNRDKLQWSVHLTNRAGLAGRRFKLMCAATGFQAELNWYKDDKLIEYDDHIIDMNDLHRSAYGCIWIEDLRAEDAGVYKCIASNGFEQIETQCKLTVVTPDIEKREFAPVFVPHRTREIYDQTSNILTLEHLIRANPPPTIKWIKGLFTLGMWPDPHIRISQHFDEVAEHSVVSLVFYDPTYKDSGEYICIATNDLGEATSVYNLKYSSEEEYFEWLAKKRPSAKLKRELELGIIVAEDAPTFDVDEILAQVEARMATTSQEEPEETSSEAETSEDDSNVPKKSAIDKANIRKPDNITRKSDVKFTTLPNVKELPELEEEQSEELAEPPKAIVPEIKDSTNFAKPIQEKAIEKTVTDSATVVPETLFVRKKTQIELDVEELERRKKFDFVSQMPNSRFELGKTFRIFAYVRCPGDITSEWKHDGRVMREGLRSSFTTTRNGTCVLEIEKCKYRDAGVYTCVAKSDKFGEIEQSCTISIFENKINGEKPVFTKNMKGMKEMLQNFINVECLFGGSLSSLEGRTFKN